MELTDLLCTMMHFVHYGMCPVCLADTVSAIAENPTRPGLHSADNTVYRLVDEIQGDPLIGGSNYSGVIFDCAVLDSIVTVRD